MTTTQYVENHAGDTLTKYIYNLCWRKGDYAAWCKLMRASPEVTIQVRNEAIRLKRELCCATENKQVLIQRCEQSLLRRIFSSKWKTAYVADTEIRQCNKDIADFISSLPLLAIAHVDMNTTWQHTAKN